MPKYRTNRNHREHLPHYVRKLLREMTDGRLPIERGQVNILTIAHDDWCAFWEGGASDCEPELTCEPPREAASPRGIEVVNSRSEERKRWPED